MISLRDGMVLTSLAAGSTGRLLPPPCQFQGAPSNSRYTDQGPIKAGQRLGIFKGTYTEGKKDFRICTTGPSAWERLEKKKPNGENIIANFVLTAGHCFNPGNTVLRFHDTSLTQTTAIGEQGNRRWEIYSDYKRFETDGAAVRLKGSLVPSPMIVGGRPASGAAPVEPGMTACESLGKSNKVTCQPIKGVAEIHPFYNGYPDTGPFWQVRTSIIDEPGDSGSPVYSPRTDKVIGMDVYGPPSLFTPLLGPPLPEKGSYPYLHPTRSQAPGLLNESFMGDLHIVKE